MSKRVLRRGEQRPSALVATSATVGTEGFEASLPSRARQPRNPISHAQIETVLSRSVGGIAIVFAAQTLPGMLAQLPVRKTEAAIFAASLLGFLIVAFVVATLVRRGIRTTAALVSAVYLMELLLWPALMKDPSAVLDGKPWLWFLCTVATSCAAISLPLVWAAAYTIVTPVVFGIVRVMPAGGGMEPLLGVLDTAYAMLLGGVVLIIIYVLRAATTTVDNAQSNALAKYSVAVRHHATEVERVEVDSIVHDSVLATLLSAAGVHNAKSAELAAEMARNAIIRLQGASGERNLDDSRVDVSALAVRLCAAATGTGAFTTMESCFEGLDIPEHVAEALYSASVQAITNSVQHAGQAASRNLAVSATDLGGCSIEISDTGSGFDIAAVPSARLGLRVSIQDRVNSVGGVATVLSSPGNGTTITLVWPRADDPEFDPGQEWFSGGENTLSARDAGGR